MPRKVEGLENFKKILELPIGSRFGLFVDGTPRVPLQCWSSPLLPCVLHIYERSGRIRSKPRSYLG